MRYPLVTFLFVFLLGPYTGHALLTGAARIEPKIVGSEAAVEHRHIGGGVHVSIRLADLTSR